MPCVVYRFGACIPPGIGKRAGDAYLLELVDASADAGDAPPVAPSCARTQLGDVTVQGHHLRAARGLLGWSLDRMAAASAVSLSTVRRLEDGTTDVSRRSRCKVITALCEAGVGFVLKNGVVIAIAMRDEMNAICSMSLASLVVACTQPISE